jgi:predicted RNA-binding protein with PUA-like domain
MRKYFLVKSEPDKYAFSELLRDGKTTWDGVRNYEARNNLRAMREGDYLLYYHSNVGKAVVGVARVAREAYPDPTAKSGDWSAVDVEPVAPLEAPVALDVMRGDPKLRDFALLRRSRLSVVPVSAAHFARIVRLGKSKIA